jgi:SNF2 family DNA or RNA helicase
MIAAEDGPRYERLDGSMAQPARAKALERFASEPSVRVLLLSLRAGGVGLNLVAAQTVYLLDPWWNPGVEEQAIDRVHRIGQSHAVRVKRFLMQHTVEDRILQLHAKKTALVKGALDARDPSDYKERATRLEDLKFMFS